MNHDFDIAELHRRLANLIQVGTIAAVDYPSARARVAIGTLLTAWLPWIAARAGGDRDWAAPEVGEQVVLLSPDGSPERGIILPALFQAAHPAPADRETVRRVVFADGTVIEYDRAAHRLDVQVPGEGAEVRVVTAGKVTVAADGDVTVAAGGHSVVTASGDVTVTAGNICVLEGVDSTRLGGAAASDPVARRSDLQAIVTAFNAHTHAGVQTGGGTTAPPGAMSTPPGSANVRSV